MITNKSLSRGHFVSGRTIHDYKVKLDDLTKESDTDTMPFWLKLAVMVLLGLVGWAWVWIIYGITGL